MLILAGQFIQLTYKFFSIHICTGIFNHYSAKVRVISLNSYPTRLEAELAKIR